MEPKFFNIPVCVGNVTLRVARGHFATRNSHTNYFIDVTLLRSSLREAESVAQQLAQRLRFTSTVDTILCMDGTRVIGTCLARNLVLGDGSSVDERKDIYVLQENIRSDGKIIFRDNARFMLEGKNVLVLLASVTTGNTAEKAIRCIRYYGGSVSGIAAIYSHIKEVKGIKLESLFHTADLPDYASHTPKDCPLCRRGLEIDAVVDTFGYAKL